MAEGQKLKNQITISVVKWKLPPNSPKAYQDAAAEGIEGLAKKAASMFKDDAPRRTGNLQGKIAYRRMSGGHIVGYEVVAPWYARITINGWGRIRQPKNGKVLKIVTNSGTYFRRKAGPIRANPWNMKTVADIRKEARQGAKETAHKLGLVLKRRNL